MVPPPGPSRGWRPSGRPPCRLVCLGAIISALLPGRLVTPNSVGVSAVPGISDRRLTVLQAVPEGSRRASSQAGWIRAVQAHPATARLRADAHRNVLAIAWVLARHASWASMTTRPTWARIQTLTGLSRSTVARWIAFLVHHRLLGIVEHGSTPRYRPVGDDTTGNRAAEYVLATPCAVEETRTPTKVLTDEKPSPSRARPGTLAPPHVTRDTLWPLGVTPKGAKGVTLALEQMRARSLVLRRIRADRLARLLTPWFRAGWTPADVLHALDYRPDGSRCGTAGCGAAVGERCGAAVRRAVPGSSPCPGRRPRTSSPGRWSCRGSGGC